ncbi:MAG: secretin and TonB N-terminal domain-containing protein [Vitreoscilla sp.]|nr:secretin and TonB N-terminal domain-containing protein [Vitreoscilla sp.]
MYNDRTASFHRTLLAVVVALALAGCAADREYSKGMELVKQGQTAKGLDNLKRATELEPQNTRFQVEYLGRLKQTTTALLEQAGTHIEAGYLPEAEQSYQAVIALEPHNAAAQRGLKRVMLERQAAAQMTQAERLMQSNKTDQALEIANNVLRESPRNRRAEQLRRSAEEKQEAERIAREEQLATRAAFRRPVSLTFRDTPLKMIFEALSRAANINVVVDRDVKSDVKTTIFVKDAPIEDAIDVLLLQNQLEKRVLNGNTILVYPATAAKQKEFAELKVRSFQLSNIDAALMASILKTMVKTKDIVTDPKTNILVMRDTAEAIALAERLVAANDLPDAEVMLEVKVLEISTNRTNELGVKLPTAATFSTPTVGTSADGTASGAWTISDLSALTRGQVRVSPISATINMLMTDGDTQLLANPSIRTRNKEKARILVGDKLPQITNVLTANGGATGSSNAFTPLTGSITYVDVGIKLEVEPEIYTDDDVGIKMMLEVSNVTGTIKTDSGVAYQIGSRSAQTSLRLHDGETQVLGGLIRNNDSNAAQRLPGLGQLPVMGRLFSSNRAEGTKTEIIVTITPHIIRPRAIPDLRNADAWSGSDTNIRDRSLRLDSIGTLRLGTPKPGPATGLPTPTGRTAPVLMPARPAPQAPAAGTAAPPAPAAPASSAASTETGSEANTVPATTATTPAAPTSRLPLVMPRTMPGGTSRQIGNIPALPQGPVPAPAEPASSPSN